MTTRRLPQPVNRSTLMTLSTACVRLTFTLAALAMCVWPALVAPCCCAEGQFPGDLAQCVSGPSDADQVNACCCLASGSATPQMEGVAQATLTAGSCCDFKLACPCEIRKATSQALVASLRADASEPSDGSSKHDFVPPGFGMVPAHFASHAAATGATGRSPRHPHGIPAGDRCAMLCRWLK